MAGTPTAAAEATITFTVPTPPSTNVFASRNHSVLGGSDFSAAPAPIISVEQLLHPAAWPPHPGSIHALRPLGQQQLQPACIWPAGIRAGEALARELVVCSTDGTLQLLELQQQQRQQLQQPTLEPPAAAAAAMHDGEHHQVGPSGVSSSHGSPSGSLSPLKQQCPHADAEAAGGSWELVGVAQQPAVVLPGEVFSSPVVLGQWVVLGCRDDNLYCLLRG